MKKLTHIVAAAFLALSLIGCSGLTKQDSRKTKQYKECINKYQQDVQEYCKGQILIGFDEGVTEEQANNFIESHDSNDELDMIQYRWRLNLAEVKVPEGKEIDFACYFDSMKDETIIKHAEIDYLYHIQ